MVIPFLVDETLDVEEARQLEWRDDALHLIYKMVDARDTTAGKNVTRMLFGMLVSGTMQWGEVDELFDYWYDHRTLNTLRGCPRFGS